jgi:hypothetical protein
MKLDINAFFFKKTQYLKFNQPLYDYISFERYFPDVDGDSLIKKKNKIINKTKKKNLNNNPHNINFNDTIRNTYPSYKKDAIFNQSVFYKRPRTYLSDILLPMSRKIKRFLLNPVNSKTGFLNISNLNETSESNFFFNARDTFNNYYYNLKSGIKNRKKFKVFYYNNKRLQMYDIPKMRFKRKFKALVCKNRSILADFIKHKITYQHKFSNFIKNLLKKPLKSFLLSNDLSLNSILSRSHLFFGNEDLKFFLKNKFIYVNNKVVLDGLKNLNEYDRVNLVFNKHYFFYYRQILSIIKNNFFKLGSYALIRKTKTHHWTKTPKPRHPN